LPIIFSVVNFTQLVPKNPVLKIGPEFFEGIMKNLNPVLFSFFDPPFFSGRTGECELFRSGSVGVLFHLAMFQAKAASTLFQSIFPTSVRTYGNNPNSFLRRS
jgi:hypothetical protein